MRGSPLTDCSSRLLGKSALTLAPAGEGVDGHPKSEQGRTGTLSGLSLPPFTSPLGHLLILDRCHLGLNSVSKLEMVPAIQDWNWSPSRGRSHL